MSCELTEQFACVCRAKSGKKAYPEVAKIAPHLSADWEKTEEWHPVSEQVTDKEVKCGGCKPWWVAAIKQARTEPTPL